MRRTGCFVIVPLIFVAFGAAFLFFSISRVTNQSTATGIVIDVAQSTDGDGDTTYRPVIEFLAENGQSYIFTGRTGSSSRPQVGSSIDVLYDPADPQGATEKTFTNLWLFPIVFGGFGLVFLIFMAIGRNRVSRRGEADLSAEERADRLDQVLDRIPDIGPSGPADSGPLGDEHFPVEATPTQGRPPMGIATAEFRRAEASISPDGTMRYRIVAKDESGNEYHSDLLDEDPTVAIMEGGNVVQLVRRQGGWIVDFQPPDDD